MGLNLLDAEMALARGLHYHVLDLLGLVSVDEVTKALQAVERGAVRLAFGLSTDVDDVASAALAERHGLRVGQCCV